MEYSSSAQNLVVDARRAFAPHHGVMPTCAATHGMLPACLQECLPPWVDDEGRLMALASARIIAA
eukprot:scaffold580452_cov24-Prasinocladus_malaysianus.AAC.1